MVGRPAWPPITIHESRVTAVDAAALGHRGADLGEIFLGEQHLGERQHVGLFGHDVRVIELDEAVDVERVDGVLKYLTDNCCEGAACALEPASADCGC